MRYLLAAITAIFLTACAATGKAFIPAESPGKELARIYIYRPAYLLQSGIFPSISVDEKPVGDLKNGGFVTFLVPAGQHTLSLSGSFFQWGHPTRQYPIVAEAGRIQYYKLDPNVRGNGFVTTYGYGFGEINEGPALEDLAKLNQSF